MQGGLRGQREVSEIVMLMRRAPQPIIAAVHGPACGGGFAIALAADVRIAGESARMNAAFIRRHCFVSRNPIGEFRSMPWASVRAAASIDAPSLEAAVAMEDRNQILAAQTNDFREGITALLQKRPAVYGDR